MKHLHRKKPTKFKLRRINWLVPTRTRHREYTVTDMCYFIQAGTPCSGCTMTKVQKPEPGVMSKDKYRINVAFVTAVAQKQVDQGINLLTYMGGDPLTFKDFNQVIRWTVDHSILNGLIYSSSSYYFKSVGSLSNKFFEHEEAGLFSHQFGYFKTSVDWLILNKKDIVAPNHPLRSEKFKSFYGRKLAEILTKKGYQVAIHQTLRRYNLDQIIPLYQWAKERGIRFSMCPLVWLPYTSRGEPEAFFSSHLSSEDEFELKKIVDYLIFDTVNRLRKGEKRIYIPSSAFTRLLPKFGPMNRLSCQKYRKMIQPNGQDIHPNGQERWCIAQNTQKDGQRCGGCFYIGIDRDGDYWNFEHLAGLKKGDIRWLNADVWIKDPEYNPSGRNLFFNWQGKPL